MLLLVVAVQLDTGIMIPMKIVKSVILNVQLVIKMLMIVLVVEEISDHQYSLPVLVTQVMQIKLDLKIAQLVTILVLLVLEMLPLVKLVEEIEFTTQGMILVTALMVLMMTDLAKIVNLVPITVQPVLGQE